MNIRKNYIDTIKRNCASPENAIKDLSYWRNNLFAGIIIYMLPFCLIALVPCLYWIVITGQYIMVVVDGLTVISMMAVVFIPGLSIPFRKVIFVASIYLCCLLMLYYIGMSGPGLIYMLIDSIICIFIFPVQYAYWSAFLNTCICIAVALAIYFQLVPWGGNQQDAVGLWITVSSHLVFLSFLSSALIPRISNGLQQTIESEKILREELSHEQQSLSHAMAMLEKKNIELEQFSYAASHDLQEPLRMITGFLDQLEKKYENIFDAKGKQYIWFALDGAKRMQQLIVDLLEFSHIGSKQVITEDINLDELINEIRILYCTQIEEKNAKIIVEPLPIVHSHKIALNQVFQNLISNSLKYSVAESEVIIKIGAVEKEMHWQFSINDNGIGISKEDFEKVFIIFRRLHGKGKYPGTGIGLAITKKNVELMGGNIWLESEENIGSTFYFTIPKLLN